MSVLKVRAAWTWEGSETGVVGCLQVTVVLLLSSLFVLPFVVLQQVRTGGFWLLVNHARIGFAKAKI